MGRSWMVRTLVAAAVAWAAGQVGGLVTVAAAGLGDGGRRLVVPRGGGCGWVRDLGRNIVGTSHVLQGKSPRKGATDKTVTD